MSYVNVSYKGNSISKFSEGSKILETSGKYCEDNISVEMQQSQNNILFHFDYNLLNFGKSPAMITDATGMEFSTTQHKFGARSIKFNGQQHRNNLTISGDLIFASGDFTIDFWVYPENLSSYDSHTPITPFSGAYRSLTVTMYTDRIGLSVTSANSGWSYDNVSDTVILNNGAWHHIAIVRSGSKIYLFLNGVKEIEINYGTGNIANPAPFSLGNNANNDYKLTGYIDEFRYIKGTAVWTADFTPPTEPYV